MSSPSRRIHREIRGYPAKVSEVPAIISRNFRGVMALMLVGGTLITRGVDSGGDNTPLDKS